jgi:uncharacterized membrane protein
MIEATIGFIAGFMLTWPALIALLVLGILFEHNGARGFAVFTTLVTMAVAYFFFSIPLMTVLLGAVAYVAIGLVWSFYRYKRHASYVVEKNKNEGQSTKERALKELHPKAMLPTITAWILVWPFSLVENFVGDIITGIQTLVQKIFRGIYHRIYDSAVAALKA